MLLFRNFVIVAVLLVLILVLFVKSRHAIRDDETKTLKQVHVVFRHGDRTNFPPSYYPTDPHINETFYPYGLGELTNKGKKKEFRIGIALRKRYNKLLGKIYTPDLMKAYSSDTSRTKMSLQLVLAGLFPPTGDQIWEEGMPWQPIPYEYKEKSKDRIFKAVQCPNYIKMYKELINSPEFQAEFEKDRNVIEYLSKHTGKKYFTYKHVYNVFAGLTTESEFGLELPSWTKKIFPRPMADVAVKYYEWFMKTVPQKKIILGYLLKKIINDSENFHNSKSPQKLYLYSGHEFNLVVMLIGLGVFKSDVPPYGSYVLVEVHQIDDVYGFKFYYQDYTTRDAQLLQMSGCEEFCPLEKFATLVRDMLPDDQSCGNEEPEPELYSY